MTKKINKMANAPVYYALVQAKFNPIAAMDSKYLSDIQDRLRLMGYPLLEEHNVAQFRLDSPQMSQAIQWIITKTDRTSGFILATSSLTYHTTHYETRHEFISEFLRGLGVVHEVVKLDHLTRLGLRYLNAVLPSSKEAVNDYLMKGLHGVDFIAEKEYTLTQSVFQTKSGPLVPNGKLFMRVLQLGPSLLGFPPDLSPQGLVPMKRFDIKEPQPHGLIDIDHFVEARMPIDFDKIKEQLFLLHAVNKEAFESITTPHAKKIWNRED